MRPLGVVVNVYNAAAFLRPAIDSLLAQSFADFELVAIDDGSTDASLEILRSYSDPRLRILENSRNLGIPTTLNRGLAALATPLVARLDADDLALPGRFGRQVEFLAARPELALVASDAHYIDELGRSFALCTGPTSPEEIRARLPIGDCIVHSSVIYRADCVRAVGGYREELPLASDYDLWIRLSERYPLASLAEPLVGYRVHRAQVSIRKLRLQRTIADRCRREAAERRRASGLPTYGYEAHRPTRRAQLAAADGTLGADLLYWCGLYEAMGRHDIALRTALRGVWVSPLSRELWRRVRHNARRRAA